MKSTIRMTVAAIVVSVLAPTVLFAQTWSNPTVAPTGGNASTPLNVSATAQSKAAGLVVGTGAVTYGLLVQNGNVGIGTLTPATKLDVSGQIRGTQVTSINGGLVGPSLALLNTDKSGAGVGRTWNIYNMTGAYGNSLQFWAYDDTVPTCGGGLCASRLNIYDSGNVSVPNGNLGVGTNSAGSRLTVLAPNTGSGIELRGGGGYTGFTIGRTTEDGSFAVAGGNGHFNNQASAGDIVLRGTSDEIIVHGNAGIKFTTGATGSEAERVKFSANGNVGIGNSGPGYKLEVSGSVGASAFFYTSDESLKKNIMPLTGSLAKVLQLQGSSFTWKEDGRDSIGLVAQDVEKVYPELVSAHPETGLKSIEYGNLIAPLIEAIKEQQKEIEALRGEVEALKQSR